MEIPVNMNEREEMFFVSFNNTTEGSTINYSLAILTIQRVFTNTLGSF